MLIWFCIVSGEDLERVLVRQEPAVLTEAQLAKKLGLLKAIGGVSKQFNRNKGQSLPSNVNTDKSLTVTENLGGSWVIAEFDKKSLPQFPNLDGYLHSILKNGFQLWCLHHQDQELESSLASRWWNEWFSNVFAYGELLWAGEPCLKFIQGAGRAIRQSLVIKPFGFDDNVHLAIDTLLKSESRSLGLLTYDLAPNSSHGVVYSVYDEQELDLSSLLSWLDMLNQTAGGLTRESLHNTNYTKPAAPAADDSETETEAGGMFISPSTVLAPAMAIHSSINDNIVSPVVGMMSTVGGYIPGSDYIPSMFSYWGGPAEAGPAPEQEPEHDEPVIINPLDKFLTGEKPIAVYLKAADGSYRRVQLVIYQPCATLSFVVLYEDEEFRSSLSQLGDKLENLFQTHYIDVVTANTNTATEQYVKYDHGKLWTTLPAIPQLTEAATQEQRAARDEISRKHQLVIELLTQVSAPFDKTSFAAQQARVSRREDVAIRYQSAAKWAIEWISNHN